MTLKSLLEQYYILAVRNTLSLDLESQVQFCALPQVFRMTVESEEAAIKLFTQMEAKIKQ